LETAAAGGEPDIEHLVGASGAAAADEDGRSGKRHKRFVAETPEALRARAVEHSARSTGDEKRRQVTAGRASLPIAQFKQPILDAVAAAQVVLVAGETGCGKTTQVPQFLLDEAWAAGRSCRMICTQPRRISAMTVADRVAFERGEKVGDGSVGYQIRLESKGSAATPVMFCTNGILLRKLSSKQAHEELATLTHIIIDEIHERDRFADFMLVILKDVLPHHPHLRLILMSATLNEHIFAQYFDGCPVIHVPGFMHPVEEHYLEDVLGLLGYVDRVASTQVRPTNIINIISPPSTGVAHGMLMGVGVSCGSIDGQRAAAHPAEHAGARGGGGGDRGGVSRRRHGGRKLLRAAGRRVGARGRRGRTCTAGGRAARRHGRHAAHGGGGQRARRRGGRDAGTRREAGGALTWVSVRARLRVTLP